MAYFATLEVSRTQANIAARNIIKGNVSSYAKNSPMGKVAANFHTLQHGLKAEGLHLWGDTKTDSISAVSWEGESAAPSAYPHKKDNLNLQYMQRSIPQGDNSSLFSAFMP